MASPAFPPGLSVKLEHSPKSGAKVKSKGYAAGPGGRPPGQIPGFKVKREIGNFQLVDSNDNDKPVHDKSKVKVTVDYTAADISAVGNNKQNLKLGVYISNAWKVYNWADLKDLGDKHNNTDPGSVVVTIEGDLSDPPMGWGGG
jgi:hypothetical protein